MVAVLSSFVMIKLDCKARAATAGTHGGINIGLTTAE
jgi:hypothetical protein